MNFSFIRSELVQATAWTLIHSLWQGLVLALLTGAMLMVTRKSDAKRRYEWLSVLFFLFLLVTGFTFLHELRSAFSHRVSASFTNRIATRSVINSLLPFNDTHITVNRTWAERCKEYFTRNAYLFVMIWFIIFIARFAKLLSELAYIQRLKHYRTTTPPKEWINKLKALTVKMEIRQYVQLLESGLVKVPMVMGILKPIILVPVGLLTQLPTDEIEAILLHELAHIRRRDYFVNLLQSFAETVFFFNPALLWLSSLLREERENCCDDLAISVTNNKTKFIDALISFQEFDLEKPGYSMGFAGKSYPLLNRVKRIINNKNKSLNTSEKSILTLGMLVLILCSFVAAKKFPQIKKAISKDKTTIFTASASPKNNLVLPFTAREKAQTIPFASADTAQPALRAVTDTVPANIWPATLKTDTSVHIFSSYSTDLSRNGTKSTLTIKATAKDGTVYMTKRVNDTLVSFSINDKEITGDELNTYSKKIAEVEAPFINKQSNIYTKQKQDLVRHTLEKSRELEAHLNKSLYSRDSALGKFIPFTRELRNGKWVKVADTSTWIKLKEDAAIDKELSQLNKGKAVKENLQEENEIRARLDEKNRELKVKLGELNKIKSDQAQLERMQEIKSLQTKDQVLQLRKRSDSLRRALMQTEQKLSELQKRNSGASRADRNKAQVDQEANQVRSIIADLEKEHIQLDLQKGWFALDQKRFIVNATRLSPELHAKFKAKYLRGNGGNGYYYGPVQLEGRGIFMDYKDLSR